MTPARFLLGATLVLPAVFSPVLAQSPAPPKPAGGFSIASLDTSANACTDFFQFACGNWIKANPIPSDQSGWGTFHELADRNRNTLKSILDGTVTAGAKANASDQMLASFYGSCMDEPALDKLGAAAVKPVLSKIDALQSKDQLPALLAQLHSYGVDALFGFGAEQDFKDATRVLAIAGQAGLGLPDRDYYFRDDAKSKEQREKYVAHVSAMFVLLGDAPETAKKNAASVMTIETALAKDALDTTSQRDPQKIYHLMKFDEFAALSPAFNAKAYVAALKAPAVAELNVTEPDFVKGMNGVIASQSLDDLKTYLRWQVVHEAAPYLSAPFVAENFGFYGKTLTGAKEMRPRWKRCVDATDAAIGEALGAAYVAKTFGPEGKTRMNAMVKGLEGALATDIRTLPWMSEVTKKKALEKLDAIANKVGYPDAFRDYTAVGIKAGDYLGNVQRANAFEFARQLAKIGKPVDRGEWTMTPPTVNAYYNPLLNSINFPVGILQPPFFDLTMDDAVNYGGIGGVIGHELTHGFDDQGSQFAANGNLSNWWTDKDKAEFDKRTDCVADQYAEYKALDGTKQNGRLTLGENVADNGGLRIAYMALMESLKGKPAAKKDNFTAEQRFFLGWGQVWCASARPEVERLQVQTDPHSLPRYRVNGTVANMPEFAKAFSCPATAPMVRGDKACRAW
jgi:putative endopeptidase